MHISNQYFYQLNLLTPSDSSLSCNKINSIYKLTLSRFEKATKNKTVILLYKEKKKRGEEKRRDFALPYSIFIALYGNQ